MKADKLIVPVRNYALILIAVGLGVYGALHLKRRPPSGLASTEAQPAAVSGDEPETAPRPEPLPQEGATLSSDTATKELPEPQGALEPEPKKSVNQMAVESVERNLTEAFSDLHHGAALRRWIALGMAGIDDEMNPELSRNGILKGLLSHPAETARDLATALSRLQPGLTTEWEESIALAKELARNDDARNFIEPALIQEIGRLSLPADLLPRRVGPIVAAYFESTADPNQRRRFIEAAVRENDSPAVQHYLISEMRNLYGDGEEGVPGDRNPATGEN